MPGTSTSTKKEVSQTTPWAEAQPALGGILGGVQGINPGLTGAQTGAINTLSGMGAAGNPFAGQVGGVANTLLAGGGPDRSGVATDAYSQFQARNNPTANGAYLDPNTNPWFAQTTATIGNDVQRRLQDMYAGAGRDPSGAGDFGRQLGRGVAEGTAPIFASAYDAERGRQMAATNAGLQAGQSQSGILSGLDQTRLGNQVTGIGAADAANSASTYGPLLTLASEAQRNGIPLQTLMQQMGIVGPMAQAFGTQTGTSQGSQTMSGAQQAYLIGQSLPNFTKAAGQGLGILGSFG